MFPLLIRSQLMSEVQEEKEKTTNVFIMYSVTSPRFFFTRKTQVSHKQDGSVSNGGLF